MVEDELRDDGLRLNEKTGLMKVFRESRSLAGREDEGHTATKMYHWTAMEPMIGPSASQAIHTPGRTVRSPVPER